MSCDFPRSAARVIWEKGTRLSSEEIRDLHLGEPDDGEETQPSSRRIYVEIFGENIYYDDLGPRYYLKLLDLKTNHRLVLMNGVFEYPYQNIMIGEAIYPIYVCHLHTVQ